MTYADVKPIIGEDPYAKSEHTIIEQYNSSESIPQLVFLGVDENQRSGFKWNIYHGSPFFALDVTPKGGIAAAAEHLIQDMRTRGLNFLEGRIHASLNPSQAAIYAEARSVLDWNLRNPFCAQCGQPTLSINGGFKRTCPPKDQALLQKGTLGSTTSQIPTDRPDCASRKGISNISFPRTDVAIIVAVVSTDGQRVLIGRQKRWPQHWYSTLAGFLEPGESIEEAVRREVWEEAGVVLGRVVLHSTQPWPYPANIMVGAIAQCVTGKEDVVLEHDPELEHARWVSLSELREALTAGTSGRGEDAGPGYKEGGLRLPGQTAIANRLLTAVTDGFLDVGMGSKI